MRTVGPKNQGTATTTRRRSSAKGGAATASRNGSASRRAPSRREAPPPEERPPGILSDHGADLCAVTLVAAGVVLALALYGAAAGSVGHAVKTALGLAVGEIRYLLPPVLVVAGVWILVGRRRPDPLRTVLGALLALLAVCGLAELAGGSPTVHASTAELSGAGGWFGVAAGHSLQLAIGTAGAAVVLVAVLLVAVVLSTGLSLARIGRAFVQGARAMGRAVRTWWAGGPMGTGAPTAPAGDLQPPPGPIPVSPWEPVVVGGGGAAASGPTEPEPDRRPEPEPLVQHPAPEAVVEHPAPEVVPLPVGPRGEPAMGPATGDWHLPPTSLLLRSTQQQQDERLVDEAGRSLVAALAAHGVETRWSAAPSAPRSPVSSSSSARG